MIGTILGVMTETELRRVIDAPIETWAPGGYFEPDTNTACLVGHASGYFEQGKFCGRLHAPIIGRAFRATGYSGTKQFDDLCRRFGIPRTVRAIKVRALAELETRTQREPATVGAA